MDFRPMQMSETDAQNAILGFPDHIRRQRYIERCIERIRAVVASGGNVEVNEWEEGFDAGIAFNWPRRDDPSSAPQGD